MSPLNRGGPLMGSRVPSAGVRPLPPPRFGHRILPPRMPPMNPMFVPGGPRQIMLPPPPGRPGSRSNGMLPLFPGCHRTRGMAPIVSPMGPRGSAIPRGPLIRGPWPRRIPMPQVMPPMRPRFSPSNGNIKIKAINNTKKINKMEEIELKKPWMTDEIRSEIQKKNKLYAKAKKNKDAVEWEEFKDLRNKVTRMIRDAKNEYLAKNPEQGGQKSDDSNTIESEGVQNTENSTEQSEQMEQTEETLPSSEQAHLYPDGEPYDQRDENYATSDDETSNYCEACDREFPSEDVLSKHKSTHAFCGIDECTFSAHPLLVEKHISMQHRTGLYQRMKNLSTPEDIEKWIMERKKKYPTEVNINLRKAEELEKSQRGEIIKQNFNEQTKIQKITNVRDKKRKPRKRRARDINSSIHTNEVYRGLCPFPGTNILQEYVGTCLDEQDIQTDSCEKITGNITDEDDTLQISETFESINLPSTNLSIPPILVADYESEEDDNGPEEMPVKKMKEEDYNDKLIKNAIHEYTSIQVREDTSIQICEETSNIQPYINVSDKSNKGSRNTITEHRDKQNQEANRIVIDNKNEKILRKYHNKLLEKLLSRSIQHERNLICQCVKYIIENNFFDSDIIQ